MRSKEKRNTPMTDMVDNDLAYLTILCRKFEVEVAKLKAANAMLEVEKEMLTREVESLEQDIQRYRLGY